MAGKTSSKPSSDILSSATGIKVQARAMGGQTNAILGERYDQHKGVTAYSPVMIVDVTKIAGPRMLPLEIAWKKAAVGD